jgi:hypothetical protein
VPTPKGPVDVHWKREGGGLSLELKAPAGMEVRLDLVAADRRKPLVVNGRKLEFPADARWMPLSAGPPPRHPVPGARTSSSSGSRDRGAGPPANPKPGRITDGMSENAWSVGEYA